MSDFFNVVKDSLIVVKDCLIHCAKSVAAFAKKLVKDVKFKTGEWSNLSKRRDLISELGERVYSLSRNGIALPEAVDVLIEQLNTIDRNLDDLREGHAAETTAFAEKRAAEKVARAAEKTARAANKAAAKAAAAEQKDADFLESIQPEADAPQAPAMEMPEEEAGKESSDSEVPTLEI